MGKALHRGSATCLLENTSSQNESAELFSRMATLDRFCFQVFNLNVCL